MSLYIAVIKQSRLKPFFLYAIEQIINYGNDTWVSKRGKVENQQKNNNKGGADPVSTAHSVLKNLLQHICSRDSEGENTIADLIDRIHLQSGRHCAVQVMGD